MTFNFQLTEDDFAAAQACHLRNYLKKPSARLVIIIGAFMVVSGVIVLVAALLRHDTVALRQMVPFIILVLLWLMWFPSMFFSGRIFRKQFRKISSLQLPVQLMLTDTQLIYTNSNGETRASWNAIERWRECKSNFMLYTQPQLFYILPKRVMQPEEISITRELLASKIRKF